MNEISTRMSQRISRMMINSFCWLIRKFVYFFLVLMSEREKFNYRNTSTPKETSLNDAKLKNQVETMTVH